MITSDYDTLIEAYRRCKRNGGSPGDDGVDFKQIEKEGVFRFLESIKKELETDSYKPMMVRRVFIPKANGKQRPLDIPIIKVRIVQEACKMIIETIFEADLQEHSFGFRPKMSAGKAIGEIRRNLKEGRNHVFDADLSSYFDMIPHVYIRFL